MAKRKIIKIDEKKCTGCGLCIPNCHEGALKIVDGKARLISDLCDGLGACIGHCPEGAITIEERAAEESIESYRDHSFSGCPGSRVMDLRNKEAVKHSGREKTAIAESQLRQWPVQIMLVPPSAPYLKEADILVAADCVPFAYPDFHNDLLKGKVLLVGCPKLDDLTYYQEKLAMIFKNNDIKSVTYAHMEVPCCFGMIGIIESAISECGKKIPYKDVTISINGDRIK